MSNEIRAWMPIGLVKGSDGKVKKMKIGGVASTPSKDTDGEYLDPNGFDLSYFLKSGYLNWNHQSTKDPDAIIGRPTKAKVKDGILHIEGELFEKSQKAQQVYALAELLEREGLQLGLSIEGKALQRGSEDKNDPEYRKVLKAMITGCAITPNPKNSDTVATLIKGHDFFELSAYEDADEEETEKAMSAGSASGMAISKESLDSSTKVTSFADKQPEKSSKKLTKGDVYQELFQRFPNIDGQSADRIYELTHKIEKSIVMKKEAKVEQVSEEAFEKALQTLDLLEKGEPGSEGSAEETSESTSEENANETQEEAAAEQNESEETTSEEDQVEDEDLEKGISDEQIEAAMLILESEGYNITKGESNDLEDEETEEVNPESEIAKLVKGLGSDIEKSITKQFGGTTQKVDAMGTLIKGLVQKNAELENKIDAIGNNSSGPKSVVTADAIEKSFDNQNDLNKGQSGSQDGKRVLSVTRNKREVLDILDNECWTDENGGQILNKSLASDMMTYESSSEVSPRIIDFMNSQGIKLVP